MSFEVSLISYKGKSKVNVAKSLFQGRCVRRNPFKNKLPVHIRILRFVEGYAKKSEFVEHQIQTGSKC